MKCLHLYLGGSDHISYFYPIESYKGDTDPECQKLSSARGYTEAFLAIVNYPPRGAHEVFLYTQPPKAYRDQAERILLCLKEWEKTCYKVSKILRSAPVAEFDDYRLRAVNCYFEYFTKLLDFRCCFEDTQQSNMFWRLVHIGCELLNYPFMDPSVSGEYWEVMVTLRKTQVCKGIENEIKSYVKEMTLKMEKYVALFAPCEDIVLKDYSEATTYTSNKHYHYPII